MLSADDLTVSRHRWYFILYSGGGFIEAKLHNVIFLRLPIQILERFWRSFVEPVSGSRSSHPPPVSELLFSKIFSETDVQSFNPEGLGYFGTALIFRLSGAAGSWEPASRSPGQEGASGGVVPSPGGARERRGGRGAAGSGLPRREWRHARVVCAFDAPTDLRRRLGP